MSRVASDWDDANEDWVCPVLLTREISTDHDTVYLSLRMVHHWIFFDSATHYGEAAAGNSERGKGGPTHLRNWMVVPC
jgi:hypothetical protein